MRENCKLDLNAVFTELQNEIIYSATDGTAKTLEFELVHRCNLNTLVPDIVRGQKRRPDDQ